MKSVAWTINKKKGTAQSRTYHSNQGWRNVGGRRIYFRSGWEVNFAWWAQFLKEKKVIKDWEYEPKKFWFESIKSGVRSYLPDFKIIRNDGTHYWVEVKGYMDSRSQTKIKRFRKYYPEELLEIKDASWFREQRRRCPFLVERWEGAFAEGDRNEVD